MIYYEHNSAEIIERIRNIIFQSELVRDRKFREIQYYHALGCGFDIETSIVHLENIDVSFCYHWQFCIDGYVIGGRTLSSMAEFFKWLDSAIPGKNRLLILDANLNYEWQFCKHYWNKIGLQGEFFAKDIREPLRILVGDSLYFTEAIGTFGSSLENIAENYCTIKKLKGDLNHDLVHSPVSRLTSKEIKYCENDVLILYQLGTYIFKNFFDKREKFPLTSTARIRNKIKKKCGKEIRNIKRNIKSWMPEEDDYTLLRNYLFKGGICGTNSLFMGEKLENILMADYTSDYPAKCFHYKFPMGKCQRLKPTPENIMEVLKSNRPFILKIEFHNLESTTSHSLMSTHKCLNSHEFNAHNCVIDNGRIFRADKCTLLLNDVELLQFGFFNENDRTAYTFDRDKTKILQMWAFDYYDELPDYVLDVIEEEYIKKAKLKEELKKHDEYYKQYGKYDIDFDKYMNLKIEYQNAKSSVNGIFGMMCTALYFDILEFDGDVISNKKDEFGEPIFKSYDEATNNLFLYPFWGFWITSYARMVLIDTIIRYPNCIVQYDTDSIYFILESKESDDLIKYMHDYNKETEKININIFGDNKIFKDLGCWDINKKTYKYFKGLGSKRYMYQDESGYHITISGCRSVNVVEYCGELWDTYAFHKIASVRRLSDARIEKIMETEKRISTLEYQYRKKEIEMDIFDYFEDGLEIEEEYANKKCSIYLELDDILKEVPTQKINVVDYQGNSCEVELSSCVVLKSIPFKMGVRDIHEEFTELIQRWVLNHPAVDIVANEEMIDYVQKAIEKEFGLGKYM